MSEVIPGIIGWLAPILSTIIVTLATASINQHVKERDRIADKRHAETEEKRKAEAEWREAVNKRLDEQSAALKIVADDRIEWYSWRDEIVKCISGQDEKTRAILKAQVTQMRSDMIHRAHRYLDDLGMASTEEKKAFWAEYEEYCNLCEKYGIENEFVDGLANRVMALPERQI